MADLGQACNLSDKCMQVVPEYLNVCMHLGHACMQGAYVLTYKLHYHIVSCQ